MTELQVTINNLKDVVTSGNRLLFHLEKAQKDLEAPPQHKWEHGDVFLNEFEIPMICIQEISPSSGGFQVFCLSGSGCDCHHRSRGFLSNGKFLFNIKEKV